MFDIVEVPSAVSTNVTPGQPSVTNTASGSRIVHAEKFADYVSSGTTGFPFNLRRYVVNPGKAATFPWLSTLAQGFEQYRFNKLVFFVVTAQPTTASGVFYYALDYNVTDQAPLNSSILMTYRDCEETTVWRNGRLEASKDMLDSFGPARYIRTGAMPFMTDPKTYDLANFWFTYVGPLTSTLLCEIWVAYDVSLMYPQTLMSRQLRLDRESFYISSNGSQFIQLPSSPNELEIQASFNGFTSFTLTFIPPGTYQLTGYVIYSATPSSPSYVKIASSTFQNPNAIVAFAVYQTLNYSLFPVFQQLTPYSSYDITVSFVNTAPIGGQFLLRRIG
jgi:hypothetical protein